MYKFSNKQPDAFDNEKVHSVDCKLVLRYYLFFVMLWYG